MSLTAILDARERRWQTKQTLARRFRSCVMSLCLNIPGADKNPPGAERAFALLCAALRNACCSAIVHEVTGHGADGSYWLMVSPLPGSVLKHMAVRLEREHPLGRLADIDVITSACEPLSRADLGLPPRACFLCDEPAMLCRQRKSHSQERLMVFVTALLEKIKEG